MVDERVRVRVIVFYDFVLLVFGHGSCVQVFDVRLLLLTVRLP